MTYAVIASEFPTASVTSPQAAKPAIKVAPRIIKAVLAKSGTHVNSRLRIFEAVDALSSQDLVTGCNRKTPGSDFG